MIAVVSGKGGVGKTMLAVAVATEMARGRKTLLIDLDFFNRGLTGLFASMAAKSPRQPLDPPVHLVRTLDGTGWSAANVAHNLFVLSYGDVEKASSTALESMDVEQVARHLGEYVAYACRVTGCDVAILDCIGGPDMTSFAACLLARHAILVSEPDKITLYGTLNFLRTLNGLVPDRRPDIRLVFNKVIPAFSARFLKRFYRGLLAKEFGGHDLLAIYPMEAHLTKAFEKTPFLTTVYPTSQLAEKTRLLLYDLLFQEAPDLLSPALRAQGRLSRWFHRSYMGRWPRVLDLDFIFRMIAFVAITFVVPSLARSARGWLPEAAFDALTADWISTAGGVGVVVLFLWLLLAIALKWLHDLDIFFTFATRTGAYMGAIASGVALAILSAGVWSGIAAMVASVGDANTLTDVSAFLGGVFLGLPLLVQLSFLNAWRGMRILWFDRRFLEGGFRITFASLVPMIAFAVIFLKL
jgi:cellulose biosynthesis protein BcsQ